MPTDVSAPKPFSPRIRKGALRAARILVKRGASFAALPLLKSLERRHPADPDVMETLARAYRARHKDDTANDYQTRACRKRGDQAVKGGLRPAAVARLLRAHAGLEELDQSATLHMARRLHELLGTDDGRAVLAEVSGPILDKHPDSVLLVYLRSVALAKGGDVTGGLALVNDAMTRARGAAKGAGVAAATWRFQQLGKIWRVVDSIARDEMAWGAGESTDAEPETEAEAQADGQGDALPEDSGESGPDGGEEKAQARADKKLVFTEPLIQGRRQDKYLQSCKRDFAAAARLQDRIAAMRAMTRQGLRRMPTYHDAFTAARHAYEVMRPEWRALVGATRADPAAVLALDDGLRFARDLVGVFKLADHLGFDDDLPELEAALIDFAKVKGAETTLWLIASALVVVDPERMKAPSVALVRGARRAPRKTHEIRDYFAWAMRARAFNAAHELYKTLPTAARRDKGLAAYVGILQREGKFDQALKLAETISSALLVRASRLDAFTSWTQIQRAGGLKFLDDTAGWYGKVPQPQKPRGVVLVMPRNVLQLRKYPLAVLMELKRMGWAVVPIVEGVLPLEPTGIARIDQFLGCTQLDAHLTERAQRRFPRITDFKADLPNGRFDWGDIDLKHPLFEEATINRRRFSVDYTCPSLQQFLARLVRWTEMNATVLAHARSEFKALDLRAGVMVLSQYRLPDTLNRYFCAQRGDPTDFFCIHASNGYENYFANFSTPVSTKAVIRNMTMHPDLRTASFPPPEVFEKWYQGRRSLGPHMLERVRDITKMKRSTGNAKGRSPDAVAASERIAEWKANGGKVACAFGKVVCDLGVPHDGGPIHKNMMDWLNHSIDCVRGSNTLLLIKPHPHELRNEISTFLTEYLVDLIQPDLPDNVMILGHDWFDIHDLDGLIDLGLLYNGTTAVELGLLGIPAVLCSDFGPIDYPIGHVVPKNEAHYKRLVRFEEEAVTARDLKERAAGWIHYLSGDQLTVAYRYHARPITNRPVYPPWWYEDDIKGYLAKGDSNVRILARRAIDAPAARAAVPAKPIVPPRRPRAAARPAPDQAVSTEPNTKGGGVAKTPASAPRPTRKRVVAETGAGPPAKAARTRKTVAPTETPPAARRRTRKPQAAE